MRHLRNSPKRPGSPARSATVATATGLAIAASLYLLGSGPASGAQDQAGEIDEHLTEATKNSGGDLDLINTIRTYSCDAVEDPDFYDRTSDERHDTKVPLTQVFDDLWYVGTQYVGQLILRTETGWFVLFDSQNNAGEVAEFTMPALEALGMDDQHPLEAVFLTHGHGDHDGGANQLRANFGPDLPIYLGSGDAANKRYSPTLIDSAVAEPQEFTVGGSTVVAQSIPGHTPGALNFLIPVHDGKDAHYMLLGGRQGHPRAAAAAKGYLTGTERTYELVDQYDATGTVLTHPTSDGSTVKMQAMARDTEDRLPNPFVIGTDRTLRAAAIWRGCAAAWLASVDATTDVPVWRVTTLALAGLQPHTQTVSAALRTGWGDADTEPGWGAVPGRTVEFTVERSNATCTAVTDAAGVATCDLGTKLRPRQSVTATFDGATDQTVDLASSASGTVATK